MLTEVKLEKLRHAARTDSVLRQKLLETETQLKMKMQAISIEVIFFIGIPPPIRICPYLY